MAQQDPYARYLQQAEELFSGGEIVRAGQIWQAVLKQVPDHGGAREGLLRVKGALDAQASAKAAAEAAETHRRATDSSVEIPVFMEPEPSPAPEPVEPVAIAQPPVPQPAPPPPSAAAPAAAPVAMDEDTQDKFLREGCTLYDMGQTEDALRKWNQLLAAVPDHAMALQYAQGARQELGLPLDGSASPSAPEQIHPVTQEVPIYSANEESADKLLREGCLLYDMGLPEEAIGKWDQALKLAPHRSDIQSFLDNAHQELAAERNAPPAPAPAARADSPADEKVKQAEHLIGMQRFEEAAFTYQQALDLDPSHQGAKAGLLRCRAAQGSPAKTVTSSSSTGSGPLRIEMDRPDPEPEAAAPATPMAAQPPAALTKPAPAPRAGLQVKVPENFDVSKLPDWVKDPKLWVGLAAGLALIIGGTVWYKGYAKDSQLQSDVAAAHRAAVAKAARDAEIPSLAESPASILSEGKQALSLNDTVRAYLIAQTLLKRDPSNGAAAQLLEQARTALPTSGLVGATAEEYQKHLHEGDLDQAGKVMDALMRANPDDPGLRSQALRLYLRLAEDHASQSRWSDAQMDLQRCRALDPDNSLTWSGRLVLLAKIPSLPKDDRPTWIALLG